MNPLLKTLMEKRSELQTTVDSVIDTVAKENREEFTEAEDKNVRDAQAEITKLDARIADLAEIEKRAKAAEDIARDVASTGARETLVRVNSEPAPKLTPGEWALHYLKANRGDAQSAEVLRRTMQNQVVSDNSGVIPQNIVGDVVKFADDTRRVTASMRNLPMPAKGKVFERPRVTQRTSVGTQSAEFDVLSSQKLLITHDDITKTTLGGTVSLSEQDIDWSEPAILDLVIADLAGVYAFDAEGVAAAAIAAKATTTVVLDTSTATAAEAATAFAAAAGTVYTASKVLPDTLYCAVDQWQFLAGLTDTAGRPLYTALNPQNTAGSINGFNGTGPLGMSVVVSPQFSSGFMAVGASRFIEWYEQDKGLAQIAAPSTLSITVAYRGYAATNIQASALCGFATS